MYLNLLIPSGWLFLGNANGQSQLNSWQSNRSRLRSRAATRSLAPSPYEIPNNSSPDFTTRSRQRTRGRPIPDPIADPQYNSYDENQQSQDLPEFAPERQENLRTTQQQRANIKTLEDSLNTERYQKRGERPQSLKRNGFVDQTEVTEQPFSRRRNDNVPEIESTGRRYQRTRGRIGAERRYSSSSSPEDVTKGENQSTPTDPQTVSRSRSAFRGRTTFQDGGVTGRREETQSRGRTRGFTSRYQNVETTVPTYTEEPGESVSAFQSGVTPDLSRTSYPSNPVQPFPSLELNQQFPVQQSPELLNGAAQFKARSDAVFPNLSTQQFSTDQSARVRTDIPSPNIQQFPTNQQFIQDNAVQNQQLPVQELSPAPPETQPPITNQFPNADVTQFQRRSDSNDAEKTVQFIPQEAPRVRTGLRSRARTPTTKTPESNAQPVETQQQITGRGRQGFRSRTRTSPTNEATTPLPRSETEGPPPRKAVFRGRPRAQQDVSRVVQQEASERVFTEEVPEPVSEANESTTPVPPKSTLRPIKPFRGTVTAKITETRSEEDIDETANYPKEFLDKLKSSKGFIPPPKRPTNKLNLRGNFDQSLTPTGPDITRPKRKQFVTDSHTSESIKEETQSSETSQEETSTPRQNRQRYSQRFYQKLAAKATGGTGIYSSSRSRTTTETVQPVEQQVKSRFSGRKSYKPFSTTTESEVLVTEQTTIAGEERRRFVPKNKLTLEERKQRIARLKEKLRKNATEDELRTEESQESYVLREALQVQANTHPGSREVLLVEAEKNLPEVKSSVTSNVKRVKVRKKKLKRSRGEARFRNVDDDLITLESEESTQTIFVGKLEEVSTSTTTTTKKPVSTTTTTTTKRPVSSSKTPTQRPVSTTTAKTTTRKPISTTTTTGKPVSRTPRTVATTTKPQAATQVPVSTTTKEPDFALLNVTLFPSTRHRFSARINSTANLSLPPDVELITVTPLNPPSSSPSLERNPDLNLSVNKLFNSSLSTTTTTTTTTTTSTTTSASVKKATTTLSNLSTVSSSNVQSRSSTTQKSTQTTKGTKKKSSGRKKSKKSKSKSKGSSSRSTSTTSSPRAGASATVSTTESNKSNGTGVRPLPLALSDVETIINETMKVVNSNPAGSPPPGVVPRSELNALTPETFTSNGTASEEAEGTTAAPAPALSKTNSSDNSTNQIESPEKLTSGPECVNGSCAKSKSQSVQFVEGGAREPLPYARTRGTTKSPETLRKIFIYGIFPNNTVQRRPFPAEREDNFFARQYSGRTTTRFPPYTAGDYDVFGVYPNNSVVRRRGWKTFDYEKYRSPYVIFGIYPNNTIVKKYPNGTTINDEFMVSDNEIRKTAGDEKVYRGCTCTDGVHQHATTEATFRKPTTTSTTTTTEAPEESEAPEAPSEPEGPTEPEEESETEEPERNAKDDAENIDFGNAVQTDEMEDENVTTTESPMQEEEEEEESEEEEEEEEEEVTESTTSSPTERSPSSISEAEEADMVSTQSGQEESTSVPSTESSEGLENAEEADNASTPRNLEETTTSLEREETQGGSLADAEAADMKDATETSGLNEAEEADFAGRTESSAADSTTERSENLEERTTTERGEESRTTDSNEEERTTAQTIEERRVPGPGEESEGFLDRTTLRSENLGDSTTEGSQTEENVTENQEESAKAEEDSELARDTTEESEPVLERTTETSSVIREDKTEENVNLLERTTEGIEAQTESISDRREESENLIQKTTEAYESAGTTEASENDKELTTKDLFGERTTERGDVFNEEEMNKIQEGTTKEPLGEMTTERAEFNEAFREGTFQGTTTENQPVREGTTEESIYLGEGTTERTVLIVEGTGKKAESEGNFFGTERTKESPFEEGATEKADENFGEGTTPEGVSIGEGTTERTVLIVEGTGKKIESNEPIREETTEESFPTEEGTTERTVLIVEGTGKKAESEDNSIREGTTEGSFPTEEGTTERTVLIVEGTGTKTESEDNSNREGTTEGSFPTEEGTTERTVLIVEGTGKKAESEDNSNREGTTEESFPTEEGTTERTVLIVEGTGKKAESEGEFIREGTTEGFPTEVTTPRTVSIVEGTGKKLESGESLKEGTTQESVSFEEGTTTGNELIEGEKTKKFEETEGTTSSNASFEEKTTGFGYVYEKPEVGFNASRNVFFDVTDEDIRELNALRKLYSGDARTTTHSPDENTVPTTGERHQTETSFSGYFYDKPTGNPFTFEDDFGVTAEEEGKEETPATTTDYDIDVRELGNLISRLTTGPFTEAATDAIGSASTTEKPEDAPVDLLNALLPLSLEYIQGSSSGNSLKSRHRKAVVNDLDEPSSLTNLAYRALSSSETTPTPIPVLTTTTTTTRTTTARKPSKKLKNLSKTSVTAYKNLTTPLPDEVYVVTPVVPDADHQKRGKVKFVTLTPGVVVTTNVQDDNDIQTMSSQHVQKVTKAPAKIPDNFLSTVFGELEEKASSPIPDILKNAENDLQGDGLSASLARRIITLALEKAMTSSSTSTTAVPFVTPQSITATTRSAIAEVTASNIQRITTPQPTTTTTITRRSTSTTTTTRKPSTTTTTTRKPTTTTTTTRKPTTTTTTKRPTTTTKKPTTTTTTTTTTPTTTRRPRTTSTTTTRRPRATSTTTETILITPKKTGGQINRPSAAITGPEYLGSTIRPEIIDEQPAVEIVPLAVDPLTVLFANDRQPPTTTAEVPSNQKVNEDLNNLLSGLWQEQAAASAAKKVPEVKTSLAEPRKKSTKNKSALTKQASDSLSESDLRLLEAILLQQGGATQDLEQIIQNQIRLAEEVRKASRNLKKKPRTTTTTTTERPAPLGLGFLLNLFGAGSRPNGLFSNEQRNSRRQRPTLASLATLENGTTNVSPDPLNELDEGTTTGERSARGELVSAAIDVTKAVSKFMGTVLTSAAQSFQNFFRNLGR